MGWFWIIIVLLLFSRKGGAVTATVTATPNANTPTKPTSVPIGPANTASTQAQVTVDQSGDLVHIGPSDSIVNGVDLFQQIQKQNLVDSVPPIGQQPANISAWINVFSSPGVWQWSLISNPSVTFMADISGHRLS
ncbi:MAG TPA: hypothetical protein VGJ33_16245 [Candidatus Angelobacter sp.]|jgi:hypothetical protein